MEAELRFHKLGAEGTSRRGKHHAFERRYRVAAAYLAERAAIDARWAIRQGTRQVNEAQFQVVGVQQFIECLLSALTQRRQIHSFRHLEQDMAHPRALVHSPALQVSQVVALALFMRGLGRLIGLMGELMIEQRFDHGLVAPSGGDVQLSRFIEQDAAQYSRGQRRLVRIGRVCMSRHFALEVCVGELHAVDNYFHDVLLRTDYRGRTSCHARLRYVTEAKPLQTCTSRVKGKMTNSDMPMNRCIRNTSGAAATYCAASPRKVTTCCAQVMSWTIMWPSM